MTHTDTQIAMSSVERHAVGLNTLVRPFMHTRCRKCQRIKLGAGIMCRTRTAESTVEAATELRENEVVEIRTLRKQDAESVITARSVLSRATTTWGGHLFADQHSEGKPTPTGTPPKEQKCTNVCMHTAVEMVRYRSLKSRRERSEQNLRRKAKDGST